MQDRILFENDHFLVVCSENRRRDVLIIGFAGRTHFKGLAKSNKVGWGEDFFNRYELDFVSITCKKDDWYQNLIESELILLLRDKIQSRFGVSKKIISYGTSMGAYAAIKFSSQFGAKSVLALSPPSRIKDHPVWGKDLEIEIKAIGPDDVEGVESVYISFDPMLRDPNLDRSLDAIYVDEITSAISDRTIVHLLPFKHFAHPVSVVLAEVGLLKKIILQIVNDGHLNNLTVDKQKLFKSRKYLKFRLRNLLHKQMLISASRLIYVSRSYWLDSPDRHPKVIEVLKKTGMFPQLLSLLEFDDLCKVRLG